MASKDTSNVAKFKDDRNEKSKNPKPEKPSSSELRNINQEFDRSSSSASNRRESEIKIKLENSELETKPRKKIFDNGFVAFAALQKSRSRSDLEGNRFSSF